MGRENILLPPGFKPWTIQPTASLCIDYAILVPTQVYYCSEYILPFTFFPSTLDHTVVF